MCDGSSVYLCVCMYAFFFFLLHAVCPVNACVYVSAVPGLKYSRKSGDGRRSPLIA